MTIDHALATLATAGTTLADAESAAAQNLVDRSQHEAALMLSLLGNPNPLTGKAHSVNSATEAAEKDDRTLQYRADRVRLERDAIAARVAYRVAELRALALANAAGRVEL